MTPADIEARLPRTEAGIGGHLDLTDDDDRAEMARLLHRLLFPGNSVTSPVERRNQLSTGVDTPETADGHTEALPPPKPGTHESSLCERGEITCSICWANQGSHSSLTVSEREEFSRADVWSYENA